MGMKLGEAVAKYLAELSPAERSSYQQELNRFVLWYGWNRLISTITISEITNYVERIAPTDRGKLEPIKAFLTYAKKQGLITTNLAAYVKLKKKETKYTPTTITAPIITPEGLKGLKEELEALKEERIHLIEEVKRARADGDLSENAPYQMAKERLRQVEALIREKEALLQRAGVGAVEKEKEETKIGLGYRVSLKELSSGELASYVLTSPLEANPSKGKISISSPLGKSLIGRREGEIVEVETPKGKILYQIIKAEIAQ